MTRREHAILHMKEKALSQEHREKLSSVQKGLPNFACRKLSEDDVKFIRENYKARDKEFGSRAWGRRFGVDHTSILDIVNNKKYLSFENGIDGMKTKDKKCEFCGKEFSRGKKTLSDFKRQRFCCVTCAATYTNMHRQKNTKNSNDLPESCSEVRDE